MKIVVDLEEFYLEGDYEDGVGDLAVALRKAITGEVVREIQKAIKPKVENEITNQVRARVEETLTKKIEDAINKVIKTGKINARYGSVKVTIEEWIMQEFERAASGNDDRITKIIRNLSDGHVEELKKRYDLAFASHIVAKMKENGLLNAEAANILLSNKPGQ